MMRDDELWRKTSFTALTVLMLFCDIHMHTYGSLLIQALLEIQKGKIERTGDIKVSNDLIYVVRKK